MLADYYFMFGMGYFLFPDFRILVANIFISQRGKVSEKKSLPNLVIRSRDRVEHFGLLKHDYHIFTNQLEYSVLSGKMKCIWHGSSL